MSELKVFQRPLEGSGKERAVQRTEKIYIFENGCRRFGENIRTGRSGGHYLNFSDPWPKDRHAKRRLPSREFLRRYDAILVPEGKVEFKTDNQDLFRFALEEVKEAGWTLEQCTFDLHSDPEMMEGNIMTEYEERFSSQGNPICKWSSAGQRADKN